MAYNTTLPYLRRGSTGPLVSYLKRLLNIQLGIKLAEGNEVFADNTYNAVVRFQRNSGLEVDGIVGKQTWGALGVLIGIDYSLRLYAQPAPRLCWRAASKMILNGRDPTLGQTVTVRDRDGTPADGSKDDGTRVKMRPDGAIYLGRSIHAIDRRNVALFGRRQGWRAVFPPLPLSDLIEAMAQAPILAVGVVGNLGHAVVFSALWTDGYDPGTLVRVHDPFPNHRGAIYAASPAEPHVRGRRFLPVAYLVPPPGNTWNGTLSFFEQNYSGPVSSTRR